MSDDTVTIVGGGIAGLSVAWELVRRGRAVTVFEARTIGSGTSAVATSYLEPRLGTTPARRLEWEALARWPDFAADIERRSGIDVGFRPDGQWRYAFATDRAEVRADFETRRDAGWDVEWLSGDALREREPQVSPAVTAAALVRDPAWVDGPALCRALATAIEGRGGNIRENTTFSARDSNATLVIANGEGADALGLDLPKGRVTKGTTLFYPVAHGLTRMLRHRTLSVVPRGDGLVVGSSRERGASSLAPDRAVVADLHAKAVRVLPALEGVVPEPRTGFRAMIGDGSLNLGRRGNLFWSLSHAGVGYLRAPLVGAELAAIICGEKPDLIAPFYSEA